MPQPDYRRMRLPRGRRVMADCMRICGQGYLAAAERTMALAEVAAARLEASPRPSWGALMTKAFAMAAAECRPMRQVYLRWPWEHVVEYSWQVSGIIMNRRWGDEEM